MNISTFDPESYRRRIQGLAEAVRERDSSLQDKHDAPGKVKLRDERIQVQEELLLSADASFDESGPSNLKFLSERLNNGYINHLKGSVASAASLKFVPT